MRVCVFWCDRDANITDDQKITLHQQLHAFVFESVSRCSEPRAWWWYYPSCVSRRSSWAELGAQLSVSQCGGPQGLHLLFGGSWVFGNVWMGLVEAKDLIGPCKVPIAEQQSTSIVQISSLELWTEVCFALGSYLPLSIRIE